MFKFSISLIVFTSSIISSIAQIKKEEITIYNNTIQLPGTLTYTSNYSPLIIWVHGSGGVTRDGNQSQYIKQFREAITTKNNIAFFSYDKRIVTPANSKLIMEKGLDISDLVADVNSVVNHFKNDNRFSKIILIGHSQGSLVAMMALANVDKYISLAGVGETIDKTIVKQISKQNIALGKATKNHLEELRKTGSIKEVNPLLLSLFAKNNQAFLLSWVKLDPLEEIKKVKIPTLIINGDKDLQVTISDAEKLHKTKANSKLLIIKNMNHVLKNIENDADNLQSYLSKDFEISKELVSSIYKFTIE